MPLRVHWDKYETALLIDTFWKIEANPSQKIELIQNLSETLRQKAVNEGIEIDDTFRNVNGIKMQLVPIAHAFFPERSTLTTSRLFEEMVALYKNDIRTFDVILNTALNMVDGIKFSEVNNLLYTDCRKICSQNTEFLGNIAHLLKTRFEFGFRVNSVRDILRLREFAEDEFIHIPEDDEALKSLILSVGTLIGDKVYCKSNNLLEELRELVNNAFETGAQVIYYEKLFEINADWMSIHTITSEEMLKEYLQKHITGCAFSKKFMLHGKKLTEKLAVTEELRRVWGSEQTESVQALSEKLPYIPLGNIWRVISGNDLFVIVSEGVYFLVDRFKISEEESADILDYVETTCSENGFASLSDVPMGDIEIENYELPQITLWNAIYKTVLDGSFQLNGRILTKDQPELDAVALLKQHIKGKSECSFDEIADKVVELIGGTNRQYAFQALYGEMIRVDSNRFIANNLVSFDVDEIDTVLADFIPDHFCAIRDVTTFAMFPVCGQSWNHYLLESYCYKYSKKFSLHVIHFNDKNAGMIAEKDFNKDYNEMLAIALSRMDVPTTVEAAGEAFFNTGYMAKRKYAKLGEIVQRAAEIRKER